MNRNRQLDVEYIQETLDEGYRYTEETKGRNLVLVIGNTGVGKSTTCNYLLGYRMKEGTYKGRPVIETYEETNIKIGHEVKSETLYAKSFVINDSYLFDNEECNDQICLLDCPGFLGNRTVEDQVIESISTELAIRSARQVKGILILISLNILQETRVKELREMVKTLVSLFKDPVEMVQYSIFIITKKYKYMPDNDAEQIANAALSSLKEYCEYQASRLRENPNLISSDELSYIDYDRIACYFSAVLKKRDDIIFINPMDNGESRKLIFDQLYGIKPRREFIHAFAEAVSTGKEPPIRPITINDFRFSEGNEDRVKFNNALYDRARQGMNLITNIQRCSETDGTLYLEILNCERKLSTLEALQCNLEEEVCKVVEGESHHSKIYFESIKIFESIIFQNDIQIKNKETEIHKSDVRKKELNEKLEQINSNNPMLFVEKSIYRHFSWWQWFHWEEMDFKADTGDTAVEIIKVQKEMKNGNWVKEVDERENGYYKIKYESKYMARPAEASVKTYIKTKDEAGNKISIKRIEEDQFLLTKQQEKLKSEIDSLKSNNQYLQATVTWAKKSKEDYKNNLKQKLEECKLDIQCLKAEIVSIKEDRKQARLSKMSYLQEFDDNRYKFNIVVSIADLLKFPSTLIDNFNSQYTEFLTCIDDYIYSFDNSSSNHLSYAQEEERNFSIKDPISGKEIKDLVVTPSGTAFDELSLLNQFATNIETPLPFVFRREDGSVEVIKFLSWKKVPNIQNYIESQRNEEGHCSQSISSVIQPVTLTGSKTNKLSIQQLKQQREKLIEETKKLKEETEVKEIDLDKIGRRLGRLQSEISQTMPELEDVQTMPDLENVQTMPELEDVQTMPELENVQTMPEQEDVQIMPVPEKAQMMPLLTDTQTMTIFEGTQTMPVPESDSHNICIS